MTKGKRHKNYNIHKTKMFQVSIHMHMYIVHVHCTIDDPCKPLYNAFNFEHFFSVRNNTSVNNTQIGDIKDD